VIQISKRDGVPTYVAADRMAEERIEKMKNSRSQFLLNSKHILNNRI
ncbi:MAG TPA: leucine dehydrogenase, partial [Bacillaceae bacterium]